MRIGIADDIFTSFERMRSFLIEKNIISEIIECTNCRSESYLIKTERNISSIVYRCKKRGCQKRQSLYMSKMPLNKTMHIIYCLMQDFSYLQMRNCFFIADSTISRYKKLLINCYRQYCEARPVIIGGENVVVEVDETVLSRRGVIRSPTGMDDSIRDTVWVLGGTESGNITDFFVKRLENRTVQTLTEDLRYFIAEKSVLYTDGYPSTARNCNFDHHVVNHSEGFRAADGTHTNNIEGF